MLQREKQCGLYETAVSNVLGTEEGVWKIHCISNIMEMLCESFYLYFSMATFRLWCIIIRKKHSFNIMKCLCLVPK